MSQIAWRKEYEIGIEAIDNQHKSLITMLNKIDANREKIDKIPILKEVLIGLVDYTKSHFHDEEAFMEEIGYPKLLEHRRQHQILTDQVVDILKRLRMGNFNINDELMSFLKKWVINHIMDHDHQIGEYYSNQKKAQLIKH